MNHVLSHKRNLLLMLFLSLFSLCTFGTEEDGDPIFTPSILPPSPTAAELGKYGQIPVGLFTGTPNINIPIYSYKTKNLSVPVSLSYNSNGIKVDQVASWVGLGWSLNAGGVITRIVRHQPDDKFDSWNMDNIGEYTPEMLTFLENAWNEQIDTEPDLFVFNFNGISGKFFFDEDSKIVVFPYQDLTIDVSFHEGTNPTTITITSQDGIRYIFGGGNNYFETSKSAPSGQGCTKNYETFIETAWYLKSIVHPLGDIINFEYGTSYGTYLTGLNQTISKKIDFYGTGMCFDNNCDAGETRTCGIYMYVKTVHLTKISSQNPIFGSLYFNSSTAGRLDHFDNKLDDLSIRNSNNEEIKSIYFDYNYSYNNSNFTNYIHAAHNELKYRMFLNTLQVKDNSGIVIENYKFEYDDINGLPPRLSYSQDHWGYFNNVENDFFVPEPEEDIYDVFSGIGGNRDPNGAVSGKGLLTRITYPTGGYHILEYEPNVIWGSELNYPSRTSLQVDTTGTNFKTPETTTTYITLPFTQYVEIDASIEINDSIWTYDPSHHQGSLTIFDTDVSEYIYQEQQITLGNSIITSIELEGGHQYLLAVEAVGQPTTTTLVFRYYATEPTLNYDNFPVGGQRIKRITSFDTINEDNEITRYYYSKLSSPENSSGNLSAMPNYFSVQRSLIPCPEQGFPCDGYGCSYAVLHSNSQEQLYNYGSHHIAYHWVTISYGENFENGGEEHEFNVSNDQYGEIIYGMHNIMGSTKSNQSWNNGLEKYNRKFKKSLAGDIITIEETTTSYSYPEETRNQENANGIVVRKKYDPICDLTVNLTCTDENIDYYYNTSCNANHTHQWAIGLLGCGGTICIAPGGNCNDTIWHVCHGHSPGEVLTFDHSFDHFDAMRYQIFSFWNYIDEKTMVIYDQNGNNPITNTTNYYYDNENHALLTRTITTDSNGDEIKSITYYPEDYTEGVANFEELIDNKFLTSLPVDQRTYRNSLLVNNKLTKFNDFGQPVEIYMAESELGTAHSI